MYHAIVKRMVRKNFERVSNQDFAALLNDCTDDVHHRFGGAHALGGQRHDKEGLRRWLDRLGRLGRNLKLTVQDVWVKGLPHDTTVIVRWSATDRQPQNPDYTNRGVHIIKMKWGKVVDIDAHEDSQAVAENLEKLAATGVEEAKAAPILS